MGKSEGGVTAASRREGRGECATAGFTSTGREGRSLVMRGLSAQVASVVRSIPPLGQSRLRSGRRISTTTVAMARGGMNEDEFVNFTLGERKKITGNTNLYRFKLDDPEDSLNLPVASCLLVRARIGEEQADGTKEHVVRPYTPTSASTAKGHFDLIGKRALQPPQHLLVRLSEPPRSLLCVCPHSQGLREGSDVQALWPPQGGRRPGDQGPHRQAALRREHEEGDRNGRWRNGHHAHASGGGSHPEQPRGQDQGVLDLCQRHRGRHHIEEGAGRVQEEVP